VDRALILETTFLVDLEKELHRGSSGPAHDTLDRHRDDRLFVTFTIAGELACGASMSARNRWETFLAPFHVLSATQEVAWQYGKAFRYLRDNGMLIGTNDLWIAATALANDIPIVTRNEEHFRRVPGVTVVRYHP